VTGGVLESSNVDLGTEFSNLILTQRGFQANARTMTTADSLLQETVNLAR
jgi:flagellar hook protein FlgE